ncbi:hypothetical protein [Granulosicoccus antarcticus]|uniref:Aminoglycoside phosphotransferase domain-containing protein n=1 Tax=Granulosicoccus antarcticus IMCC3135 TaxID=1192854 RepID=A0A2Z2NYU7_9GAMM|nr:hypothetical protein [Granulosicoccus antarcticus]ASJ74030.1 hypothetical protein IMCC3135_19755 [Granulosicoccus antarcticus IMCC3135]
MTFIRRLSGHPDTQADAAQALCTLLNEKFDFSVVPGSLVFDVSNALALNSLRAEFRTEQGQHLFLKCHHEEGEADRVGEYYRAGILEAAGFPVDSALYQSSTVGEQLVIYPYRDRQLTPELHSLSRDIEKAGCPPALMSPVIEAFDRFQEQVGQRYLDSLHMAEPDQVADEAIHGLYHRRLVDHQDDEHFGARIRDYYLGRQFALPNGQTIEFEEFWHLQWTINECHYPLSLHDALTTARTLLKPMPTGPVPAMTAHGDDHTGNLLYNPGDVEGNRISYFDPAFAGSHIPALQAPCKALYHICYAHPNMLYDPAELEASVSVELEEGILHVNHDWQMSPLRQAYLQSQIEHVWEPLIAELQKRGSLPENWQSIVNSTLLCCPVLCKNLLPGYGLPYPLTETASILTFSIAMQLAAGGFSEKLFALLPGTH